MSRQRGTTLVEFAITWPLVLLTTLAAVQVTLWATATSAARSAALAGARAGATAGGTPELAAGVVREVLSPALFGTPLHAWCPPGAPPQGVWVCARDGPTAFSVDVRGTLPALAPLAPGGGGLPLSASASLPHERFQ